MTYGKPNATTRMALAESEAISFVKKLCPHLSENERAKVAAKIVKAVTPIVMNDKLYER